MQAVKSVMTTCLIIGALAGIAFGIAGVGPQSNDQRSLRTLVERFNAAYQSEKLEDLMSLWSSKAPSLAEVRTGFQNTFTANEKIKVLRLSFVKLNVERDTATVRIALEVTAVDAKTGNAAAGFGKQNRNFHFVRENDEWKIWRYASSEDELAAAIAAAKTDEERRNILDADRELIAIDLQRSLCRQGDQLFGGGSYQQARSVYLLAREISERLNDKNGQALVFRGLGNVTFRLGDYPAALKHFMDGLKLAEESGDKALTGILLNNLGTAHLNLGDPGQASDYFRKSLKIKEEIGDTAGVGRTLIGLGTLEKARARYVEALAYFNRSLEIAESAGNKRDIALTLNNIGDIYRLQGDYSRALEYFEKGLQLARDMANKPLIVISLTNIGIIYDLRGKYQEALSYHHQALRLAEEMGQKESIVASLGSIGIIHQMQGNYREALDYQSRALKLSEEMGERSAIISLTMNLAITHQSLGNYSQALDGYHRSLKLAEETGTDPSNILIAISSTHQLLGNYSEALDYSRRGLKIKEQAGDKGGIAATWLAIGNVYMAQGDYAQALVHYDKALRQAEQIGNKQFLASALSSIGLLHLKQGNLPQALDYYQRSRRLAEELGSKSTIASALEGIGLVHNALGNRSDALSHYQKSLELREAAGDRAAVGNILVSIAIAHQAQSDFDKASDYFERSLKIAEQIGDKAGIARALRSIGYLRLIRGNYAESLDAASRAAALAKQIGAADEYWRAQTIAGKALRALGRPEPAGKAYEDAISTIEALRTYTAGGEQDEQRFFDSRLAPYQEMISLLVAQGALSKALSLAERSKSRVLLDVLNTGKIRITTAMSTDEQKRERELTNEITSLNTQSYREKQRPQPDQAQLDSIDSRLTNARLDLESFQTALYAAHPELKVSRVQVPPLRPDDALALIPDEKTALVEFVVTDDNAFLFTVTKSSPGPIAAAKGQPAPATQLKAYSLNIKREDLTRRVEQFRRRLAGLDLGFENEAKGLFDLLFRQARADLKGKTNLVIVPDGPLWELPFQALQSAPKRFLIQDGAISYAQSLTLLLQMKRSPSSPKPGAAALLAVGNPSISESTVDLVRPVLMDEKFGPLPDAERQVRQIGSLYGAGQSKVLVGEEAREDRFKAEADSCRILHLATHGVFNDKSPMYSHLLLAQPRGGETEDGLLEAREIMNMDWNADLVVLSACETARGRVGGGEGIIGLTWSSFIAGAPTVVVSQWKVEASSTTELMVGFHSNLKSGLPKAEALRRASLALLKTPEFRHPFYWAGFILVGRGN